MGVDARGFPGGLLRLDPAFAYVEPPSSWPLPWAECLMPRQDYWSGLPFFSPRDLPDPGIEHKSPTLQADSYWATRETWPRVVFFKWATWEALDKLLLPNSRCCWVFLVAQMVKNPPAIQETWVQFLGLGRSPGGGHGNPLQYSWLENPMGRGAWRAIVHGVA